MSKFISIVYFYKETTPTVEEAPFRCHRCGRLLATVNRDVITIVTGEDMIPTADIVPGMAIVTQKCRGCPQVYKFYFQ